MKDTEEPVWAIVELMGHVRLAGRLTEEEKFGAKMGRLDIPQGDGWVTQYFGGGSVYRLTIVSEAVARDVSKRSYAPPVQPWDYPKQLTASAAVADAEDDDFDHDEDDR